MGRCECAMMVLAPAVSIFRWPKKRLWLAALLPLLFVSDILYGAMDLLGIEFPVTPGVVLRGIVVLTAFYMVVKYHRAVGKRLVTWLFVLVVSVLPSVVIGMFHGQSVFFDVSMLSKVLYLPLVTGLFVVLIRRYRIGENEVIRFVEYAAYLLGVSLLASQMTGFARQTYGDYAFGSTGVFYAQNDMTLAFGLSLLAGGYRLVMERFSLVRLGMLMTSAFACVQIGTRASLGVLAGVALTATACLMWGKFSSVHRRGLNVVRKWVAGAFVLFAALAAVMYGLSMQKAYKYQQDKLEQIAEGDFPRLMLVVAGMRHIEERNAWFDVFGEGADAFQRGVAKHFVGSQDRKSVEVDWMDIFGNYGIIFTLLIHAFVLSALSGTAFRFIIKHEPFFGLIAAATLLYLGHASVAGHALTSPIPSTLAAAYLALYFVRKTGKYPYRSHLTGKPGGRPVNHG